MACFQPFLKKNKFGEIVTIPCGWCINCRVDKRNQWIDRCNYELKNKVTSTFLTLTYDELNIIPNLVHDSNGQLLATINYDDIRSFIDRLRKRIKYLNKDKNEKNILMQNDFTYIYVGEYGHGKIPRPHFHLIVCGLDYLACERIFQEEWNKGFIYSLPVKNGCTRYVLKYMDKQVNGADAKKMYDNNGLVRPKMVTSTGFGSGLYLDDKNYLDVVKNNYTYLSEKNKRRPIPRYYLNKIGGRKRPDDSLMIAELNDNGIKLPVTTYGSRKIIDGLHIYGFCNDYLDKKNYYYRKKAIISALNEINNARSHSLPVYGSESCSDLSLLENKLK